MMKIARPASQGSSVRENSSTQMESKVKGSDLRLPCPVRYGDPEFYANVTEHCKAGKTFKGMREVIEHLKDFHFPKRWCDKCNMTYERREKKFHLHQNEQRQSECKTNDNDPRQSNNEKSKRKQNQSKNNKSKVYPPELSKAVAEQVENWKETFQNHGDDNLVVAHWKHVYKLIYPEKDMPDLSSITSPPESPPKKSEPSASSASAPPVSRQKAKKRKGSSSPVGEPRDGKRQPVNSETQGTSASTEDVPILSRVAKGDGDAVVSLDTQRSMHNNTAHSVQNIDDPAYLSFSAHRNHGVAPEMLINNYAIDQHYWDPSQPPSLFQGGGTSAPPSTVARSEIVPNDLPSPSTTFPSDDYPLNQKIGGMGALGGGHTLDPSQWPVIEEEDFELFS